VSRRLRLPLLLALAGCAYFNGIYNARDAASDAERLEREGRSAEAREAWLRSAASAESVLVRHGDGRWGPEALFLAGRGLALGARCDRALPLLERYLAGPVATDGRRGAASLAVGRCLVDEGRAADALDVLAPLAGEPDAAGGDAALAEQAARWAARAALALGRDGDASRFLARLPDGEAEWERLDGALARGDLARAESLLVRRGAAGDASRDVPAAIRVLWDGGNRDGARRVVEAYERAGAEPSLLGRIRLSLAERLAAAGDDDAARALLRRARAGTADTLVDRTAAAWLTLLSLGDAASLGDAEGIVERGRSDGSGTPLHDRLERAVLLVRLLESRQDTAGAALFLAAEVARDSLRAPRLARRYLARILEQSPPPLLAPKALLAAAALVPDSAPVFRARLLADFPRSGWSAILRGDTAASSPDLRRGEALLAGAWSVAGQLLADSLTARAARPARAAAPAIPEP
jgi:hypothetical protein